MDWKDVIGDNYRIRKSNWAFELLRVVETEGVMDSEWNTAYAADLRTVMVFKEIVELERLVSNIRNLKWNWNTKLKTK